MGALGWFGAYEAQKRAEKEAEEAKLSFINHPLYQKALKEGKEKVEAMVAERMKQETKMTREEAIEKVTQYSGGSYGGGLIGALEALGLVKFDNQPKYIFKDKDGKEFGILNEFVRIEK